MRHMDMEKFANGSFTAQVNREIAKVMENIQDPNTDATAKRRVTVVIEFKANENRDFVAAGVQAKSTLAPALGAVTALNVGKDLSTGQVDAVEIGNQIPGQLSFARPEEDGKDEMIRTVDQSTGEIYEAPAQNVVDLRRVREG